MSLKKNKDLKLYFSISEVAQMFDVNESTLRFWEKEFDIINPRKTSKGTRFYKQEDIDAVRLIYHLVKAVSYTHLDVYKRQIPSDLITVDNL